MKRVRVEWSPERGIKIEKVSKVPVVLQVLDTLDWTKVTVAVVCALDEDGLIHTVRQGDAVTCMGLLANASVSIQSQLEDAEEDDGDEGAS